MYLFIAIIFTAELIIAWTLVSNIRKADKYVCALSDKIIQNHVQTEKALFCFRDSVKCIKECFEASTEFLKCKQHEFKMKIIKTLLIYALLLIIKTKYKRLAKAAKFIVFAKDYWDALLA